MWRRPLEWNLNGTTEPRDGSVDHLSLNSLKDRHGPIRAPKSLHVRRRDQLDLETGREQLPRPVMRRRAGLHRHDATRKLGEELRQRPAPHLVGDDDLALRVDAVDLERIFAKSSPMRVTAAE